MLGQDTLYASPNGLSTNTGLDNSPLDLKSAINSSYRDVKTVILKNGAYQMTEDFDFDLTNRQIRAETLFGVTIDVQDFDVAIKGDSGTLRGIIFESSTLDRVSDQANGAPTDISGGMVAIVADNSLIHNCVFRNLTGLSSFRAASNCTIDACNAYYIGWIAPNRGHGHAIYTQNDVGYKNFKRNFFHDCFGWGIHAYASSGVYLSGMIFEGNICFKNGSLYSGVGYTDILIGSEAVPISGLTLRRNYTFGGASGLRFYGAGANGVILENNYISNTIAITGTYTAISDIGNTVGVVGNVTFIEADEHDATMAYLAIYNQSNANTVQVDVSAIYENGDIVNVMNAQDFQNDVQVLTVTNGKIMVNMQANNRTVETPIAWPAPVTSFPSFGAFLVRKQ